MCDVSKLSSIPNCLFLVCISKIPAMVPKSAGGTFVSELNWAGLQEEGKYYIMRVYTLSIFRTQTECYLMHFLIMYTYFDHSKQALSKSK